MDLDIQLTRDDKGGKWFVSDPLNSDLEAYMSFVQAGAQRIIIDHTVVPEGFSQKGTGKALLKSAIDYMRENKIITLPTCPFALGQLRKHPEWHDVLDPSLR